MEMNSVPQVKSDGCTSCIPARNIFRRIRTSCKTYPDNTAMELKTGDGNTSNRNDVLLITPSKVRSASFSVPVPLAVPSLLDEQSSDSTGNETSKSTKFPSPFGSKELIVLKSQASELFAKQRFAARLNIVKDVREDREGVRYSMSAPVKSRKYIPLKPGRSLMDWIRLTNASQDLSGLQGRKIDVTEEELAKHNSVNDAWISLKGKVYNITAYLEYHPGGIDILMSGVGKDSTDLFLQTHKWVNFETMLEKCFVGRLITISAPLATFEQRSRDIQKRRKQQLLTQTSNFLSPNDVAKPSSVIRCDWYQSETSVIIVMYTNYPDLNQEDVIIDKNVNEEINITVYLCDHVFYYNMELYQPIQELYEIKIGFVGKLEIVLAKTVLTNWLTIGSPVSLHKHRVPINQKEYHERDCQLISKTPLTSNTYLFSFQLPKTSRMLVPVAKHVVLTLTDNDMKISRSYTPVPKSLLKNEPNDHNINLIIKIYEDGAFTSHLNTLEISTTVTISDYFGQFSPEKLNNIGHFFGISGGTGITPILSILHNSLIRNRFKFDQMKILYFTQTEDDIIYKEQLETIDKTYSNCEIKFVIAEPMSDWHGSTGTITKSLLNEFIPSPENIQKLVCICGPTNFNRDCVRYLEEIGIHDYEIFVFSNEQLVLSS